MDSMKQSPLRNSITFNEEEEEGVGEPNSEIDFYQGEYGTGNQSDDEEDGRKIRPEFLKQDQAYDEFKSHGESGDYLNVNDQIELIRESILKKGFLSLAGIYENYKKPEYII
ncbi:hypothetical protein Glove_493g37 [Diversispora epigaea]|uniref:Uncharacterized protein n=1 Tax=Diversispora epigaea TaxID=1348612 RepID=A0A397GI96_9GLOM|nr:hypothetical protein Glove_493g37 [Diversispora epigaea]